MASASDIRGYVYNLVSIFPGFLQTPARWVADRVFSIWNEIYSFLVMLPDAFKFFRERFHLLMLNIVEFGNQIAFTLQWFTTIFVPRWARWALNLALNTLRQEYTLVRNAIFGVINTLRGWAQAAINRLDAFAHGVWDWAIRRFQEIWGTVNTIKNRVFQLLTSPETFVDWVFAALWRRFWKYVNDHAEPIVSAWWANRNGILMKSLLRFEAFLARIL